MIIGVPPLYLIVDDRGSQGKLFTVHSVLNIYVLAHTNVYTVHKGGVI